MPEPHPALSYCAAMKNIMQRVRGYLKRLAGQERAFERLARRERELRKQIKTFSGADRLPRDEIHRRSIFRRH
jgi:cell division protein FtsB